MAKESQKLVKAPSSKIKLLKLEIQAFQAQNLRFSRTRKSLTFSSSLTKKLEHITSRYKVVCGFGPFEDGSQRRGYPPRGI